MIRNYIKVMCRLERKFSLFTMNKFKVDEWVDRYITLWSVFSKFVTLITNM